MLRASLCYRGAGPRAHSPKNESGLLRPTTASHPRSNLGQGWGRLDPNLLTGP